MKRTLVSILALSLASCTTMHESLELGSGLGLTGGAAATYATIQSTGQMPSLGDVALGAGVGMAVGLVTSYFTHKSVEKDRQDNQTEQIEMHFGDLPPSPFVIPSVSRGGTH